MIAYMKARPTTAIMASRVLMSRSAGTLRQAIPTAMRRDFYTAIIKHLVHCYLWGDVLIYVHMHTC
jgi:hypothetical protein